MQMCLRQGPHCCRGARMTTLTLASPVMSLEHGSVCCEAAHDMKSILVPTEQNALLPSILQSALLLARKFDSYMDGFALFPAMIELYALDSGAPLPIEEIRDHDAEMAREA